MTTPDLRVRIASLDLRNPVLVASGTYGSGTEVEGVVDLSKIGGVVTKSVTTKPRAGNPPPRIWETASGMLNSIGIMNPGVEAWKRNVLPAFRRLPTARIVNVAGESIEDFESLTRAFGDEDGVDAIELNVSCPNVSGGLDFGVQEAQLETLVARCRRATQKPLIAKLTPNVTDVALPARAAERGGADALALTNTYLGMAVDWRKRAPRLGSTTGAGGLSGPAIKPLALYAVSKVARAVKIPVIAIGGICDADDLLDFVVAGAVAGQVGTQNFIDPAAAVHVADALPALLASVGVAALRDLVGALRIPRGAMHA